MAVTGQSTQEAMVTHLTVGPFSTVALLPLFGAEPLSSFPLFSCLPRELPCSEMACSREKITNQSLVPAGFPMITRKEEEKVPFSLGYRAGGKCGTCSLLLRGCRYHQLPHPLRVNPGDVGPRERRTLPLLEVPFLLQSLLGKICPYPQHREIILCNAMTEV